MVVHTRSRKHRVDHWSFPRFGYVWCCFDFMTRWRKMTPFWSYQARGILLRTASWHGLQIGLFENCRTKAKSCGCNSMFPMNWMCVCVEHLNRCKTSCLFSTAGGTRPSRKRMPTKLCVTVEAQSDQLYVPAISKLVIILPFTLKSWVFRWLLRRGLLSKTSLILHAWDSVPHRSYDGSIFV